MSTFYVQNCKKDQSLVSYSTSSKSFLSPAWTALVSLDARLNLNQMLKEAHLDNAKHLSVILIWR